MQVETIIRIQRLTARAADLAADYRARGLNRFVAWDTFVKDRALKPEMGAKKFYALYESVVPCYLDNIISVPWEPTHWDTFLDWPVQIKRRDDCWQLLRQNGANGSEPGDVLPTRYVALAERDHVTP